MESDRPLCAEEQIALDRVHASARRGQMRAALEDFLAPRIPAPSEAYQALQKKYAARFFEVTATPPSKANSLLARALAAFHAYWREALLAPADTEGGAELLYSGLAPLLGGQTAPFSPENLSCISGDLRDALCRQGIFSLWGRVLPHFEFMAWRAESEEPALVNLPDGEVGNVNITYLDDFASLGWTGFATFDKIHNGGWAAREPLFCVRPYYDLNSERFRVSYLAHEARHFSDYQRFPCLQQADLEYRAKLTELALAEDTLVALAAAFRRDAFPDSASPHAFAAHQLTCRLEPEMTALERRPKDPATKGALKTAALALLAESTARLESLGASTVRGMLR